MRGKYARRRQRARAGQMPNAGPPKKPYGSHPWRREWGTGKWWGTPPEGSFEMFDMDAGRQRPQGPRLGRRVDVHTYITNPAYDSRRFQCAPDPDGYPDGWAPPAPRRIFV